MKKQRLIHNFPVSYVQENLTVVSEAYSVRRSPLTTKRYVDCLCKCGNVAQVSVSRLASGKAKSCGCYNKERASKIKISDSDRVKNSLIREYKSSAKCRNLTYSMSDDFLFSLVKNPCYYCNSEPFKSHREDQSFLYNGLDRLDNNIGYLESNVTPCCFICNKMKGVLSEGEFMEHLNKIFTRVA